MPENHEKGVEFSALFLYLNRIFVASVQAELVFLHCNRPAAGFALRTDSDRKIHAFRTTQAAIFSPCAVSLWMVRTSTGRCFLTGDIMASCLIPTMFPLSSNMQVRIFACCMFRTFPVSRWQNPAVSSRLTGCGRGMHLSRCVANRSVS